MPGASATKMSKLLRTPGAPRGGFSAATDGGWAFA
jgi:hypothetical protein